MRPVAVRILHPDPGPTVGPFERLVAATRTSVAERHRIGFLAAGADDVRVVTGRPDDTPFGRRLRELVRADRYPGGLIVLGSGAVPLATARDRRDLVEAAGADEPRALTNNRYSGDVIAIARAVDGLGDLPDLPGDNALPRWLAEAAGYAVSDLRRRWRLGVDIDGPLDAVLIGGRDEAEIAARLSIDLAPVAVRLATIRAAGADAEREVLVAGRTSAASLAWMERATASRTRAIIEERGLRTARPDQRPPASVLGALLDRVGPEGLGSVVAGLAQAALIDTRVLLAHRLGADERGWPAAEDRFASDLLCPTAVADPWLRILTQTAVEAPVPILLGGHTLVGPGLRLVFGR